MMQCSFLAFKGDMSHYHLENIQQPQNMTRLQLLLLLLETLLYTLKKTFFT